MKETQRKLLKMKILQKILPSEFVLKLHKMKETDQKNMTLELIDNQLKCRNHYLMLRENLETCSEMPLKGFSNIMWRNKSIERSNNLTVCSSNYIITINNNIIWSNYSLVPSDNHSENVAENHRGYTRNKNIMLNGYHTIEMSLIMPIIIASIWLILYLSLTLYDYNLAEQSAYLAAFRGSSLENSKSLIEEEVQKQGSELVSKKLLLGNMVIENVETKMNKTKVCYNYNKSITMTKEVTHFRPANFIRICRTAEKLISTED